jgi:hypothetical protein
VVSGPEEEAYRDAGEDAKDKGGVGHRDRLTGEGAAFVLEGFEVVAVALGHGSHGKGMRPAEKGFASRQVFFRDPFPDEGDILGSEQIKDDGQSALHAGGRSVPGRSDEGFPDEDLVGPAPGWQHITPPCRVP